MSSCIMYALLQVANSAREQNGQRQACPCRIWAQSYPENGPVVADLFGCFMLTS